MAEPVKVWPYEAADRKAWMREVTRRKRVGIETDVCASAIVLDRYEATVRAAEAKIVVALNALATWENQTGYEGVPAEESLRVASSVLREIGEALR